MSCTSDSDSTSSDEEVMLHLLEVLPRPRIFRNRSNPMEDYDDVDFKCLFRLSKQTVMDLLHLISPEIEIQTARSMAVSTTNQLLITLRYYATGAFQRTVGDHIHVNKSTVCRIIKRFITNICRLRREIITMPEGQFLQTVKQEFYLIHNFPNIIGALDCSHMRIQNPGGNEGERFRNRKGYFSINAQVVCTAKLKIIYVVTRWPGSVHDSTIFDASHLRSKFENNEFPNCFLLGDSGYPCRSYLLTPLQQPTTEAEARYQQYHIATRNPVERLFGVRKKRFPVLSVGMGTVLDTTLRTIVATAVLHNIATERNDNLLVQNIEDFPVEPVRQQGNATRTMLINTVFTQ